MPHIFVNEDSNVINIRFTQEYDPTFLERLYLEIDKIILSKGFFYIFVELKGLTLTYLSKNREWLEMTMNNASIPKYYDYLVEVRIFNTPFITRQILSILSKCVVDIKRKVKFVKDI